MQEAVDEIKQRFGEGAIMKLKEVGPLMLMLFRPVLFLLIWL